MKPTAYAELLKALQSLEKRIARDGLVRAKSTERPQAERWHQESETGGRFDDFAGVLAGRSAVQFLLRTVYVRVLEDLGLLTEHRIRGRRGFQVFREVAPSLGVRAYFAYVFRDLAVDFPALFTTGDELDLPDEALCQDVWDLWHAEDGAGNLRYDWQGEGFESRFLGDLYQDLDADVRKRFALLQTPDFVEKYILDHTLTPAMAEFEGELLAGTFRLIDPACGSGHFLVGAFHRFADWWQSKGLEPAECCDRAMKSLNGCDINPHAVGISLFRLILAARLRLKATGSSHDYERLVSLALKPNLICLDALIPWENYNDLAQKEESRLSTYATPWQRTTNKVFLDREEPFHVVVGNPPYITPKDPKKRDDYRHFWSDSAAGKYGLTAPFVERFLELGRSSGGYMGQITGNAFLKRSFGKPLIEKVLPQWDVTDIIDTSGAHISGHGTPTVILFARCRPPTGDTVRVLGGKRGEPGTPAVAAEGKVWRAVVEAGIEPDDSNVFITVIQAKRAQYAVHPWNLGGGGAVELQEKIDTSSSSILGDRVASAGFASFSGNDEAFLRGTGQAPYANLEEVCLRGLVAGESIRDYLVSAETHAIVPYDRDHKLVDIAQNRGLDRLLRPLRSVLLTTKGFGGKTRRETGEPWWQWFRWIPSRYSGNLVISWPYVATHQHFALGPTSLVYRGGASAPVIKLPATATLDDHLDLLGLLNSSTLCFWMKQVFFDKGFTGGGTFRGDDWEVFYEFDSTKLQRAPITDRDRAARITLATALDAHAQARAASRPAAVLAAWAGGSEERASPVGSRSQGERSHLADRLAQAEADHTTHTRAMVALQEELDWLTYGSYGLLDDEDPAGRLVAAVADPEPVAPGHRPFEILLARHNVECDEEERSGWFARHGHDEVVDLPTRYGEATRARMQARLGLIEHRAELQLLEQPQFKRRWQPLDFAKETQQAAADWLLDRLEDFFQTATPRPHRLEEIVLALRRDPRVEEVASIYAGTLHADLEGLLEGLLGGQALPDNPYRLYTQKGIEKWRQWQATWALQDLEDAGEAVKIEPPPEFDAKDFKDAGHFRIRGRLNVPRERFILFADLKPTQYGWNGWRDLNRALAQEQAYAQVEQDPHDALPAPTSSDPRRCGPTLGLWEALPDVKRWGRAEDHGELLALAAEACGQKKCPCDVLEAWQATVQVTARAPRKPAKPKSR